MNKEVALALVNAQRRAPVMDRPVLIMWRLHSLLPERRVVAGVVVEAEVGAVEAEVVETEVRSEASLCDLCIDYAWHFTFCSEIRHHERCIRG